MRVHIIKKQTIEEYCSRQAKGKSAFQNWLESIKYADWDEPGDIKQTFNSVDFLGDGYNRVIFNIGGNNYRMICKYAFGKRAVHLFVCWVGTHAEYDKLCDKGEQYTVNKY
ncbi:MAG: type II toxin-antitoxin system HigB family toxin [Bacteroidota bacterium]